VLLLPIVAGFVGADTVGMVLSTHMDAGSDIRVAVDIGTNAEMVMGGRHGLTACSSPAGPALEGAQIRCGMRAAMGAIDKVVIDGDLRVQTIGGAAAVGVCGSGLIDALAALLDAGMVAPSGRMLVDPAGALARPLRERIRMDKDDIPEVVLVWAADSGSGKDITLGQGDVRQIQLAKAAIKSGVATLQRVMEVENDGISELLLSGAFGNYLSVNSVRRIGLIPDLPPWRVRYVANAAGLGAKMALLSEPERRRAETIARGIEHVSLASYPGFQDIFVKATVFPEAITDYPEAA
jgi:uncharacterized 2Fe-2S/4Fe-4S cluster protein (DUF4445 family)